MMNLPLVSIIIPVYNAEQYVGKAIESVLSQTWQNIELIIIIDGAEDNSSNVVKSYNNDNIKVIDQNKLGASAARNRGINEAKGKYVQFLDADDILDQDKIRIQVEDLEDHLEFISFGSTAHFNDGDNHLLSNIEHGWFEGPHQPVEFLTKLYGAEIIGENYGGMIQPNAWLTPKSVISKAGFWDESLTLDDDGEFFCRVVIASKGILYSKKSINYYRKFKSKNNLSSSITNLAFKSAIKSTQLKYDHLSEKMDQKLLNKIFSRLYWAVAVDLYPKKIFLYKEVIP